MLVSRLDGGDRNVPLLSIRRPCVSTVHHLVTHHLEQVRATTVVVSVVSQTLRKIRLRADHDPILLVHHAQPMAARTGAVQQTVVQAFFCTLIR